MDFFDRPITVDQGATLDEVQQQEIRDWHYYCSNNPTMRCLVENERGRYLVAKYGFFGRK